MVVLNSTKDISCKFIQKTLYPEINIFSFAKSLVYSRSSILISVRGCRQSACNWQLLVGMSEIFHVRE